MTDLEDIKVFLSTYPTRLTIGSAEIARFKTECEQLYILPCIVPCDTSDQIDRHDIKIDWRRVGMRGTASAANSSLRQFTSNTDRYEVAGWVNENQIAACPDNGASDCFISETLAKKWGLSPVSDTSKVVRIGSGRKIRSLGDVEVDWRFDNEPRAYPMSLTIVQNCPEQLILGSKFLAMTKTMRVYFSQRVRRVASFGRKAFGFKLCGDTAERVRGRLDGKNVSALPDFGSEAMLISAKYARERGFKVDYRHSEQIQLEFADGSMSWTNGIVRGRNWTYGKYLDGIEADFYVLNNMPVDIVLSKHFLMETDAFSAHEDSFYNLDTEPQTSELALIRLVQEYRSFGERFGRVAERHVRNVSSLGLGSQSLTEDELLGVEEEEIRLRNEFDDAFRDLSPERQELLTAVEQDRRTLFDTQLQDYLATRHTTRANCGGEQVGCISSSGTISRLASPAQQPMASTQPTRKRRSPWAFFSVWRRNRQPPR